MPPTEAQLHNIAISFLSAFKDLSVNNHLSLRAPDCIHIFAPASLNPPAPKSNEVFAAHITNNLQPILEHFPVTAKETYVNVSGKQITIWATGKPEFKPEAMGLGSKEEWDYTGEYIFILDVNDNGKIARILEFLDSLATDRLRKLMVRAKENVGMTGQAW